jgi:hypothetical protein
MDDPTRRFENDTGNETRLPGLPNPSGGPSFFLRRVLLPVPTQTFTQRFGDKPSTPPSYPILRKNGADPPKEERDPDVQFGDAGLVPQTQRGRHPLSRARMREAVSLQRPKPGAC